MRLPSKPEAVLQRTRKEHSESPHGATEDYKRPHGPRKEGTAGLWL